MINYEELARDLFYRAKESMLDLDRDTKEVETTDTYDINGELIEIQLEGSWGKLNQCSWAAYKYEDSSAEFITSGSFINKVKNSQL